MHYFVLSSGRWMIRVLREGNCLKAAKLNTEDIKKLLGISSVEGRWMSYFHKTPVESLKFEQMSPWKTFCSSRSFIFTPLSFHNSSRCAAIDRQAPFVSFCGCYPTFFGFVFFCVCVFLSAPNRSVASQFISPRLQFLLFIVWKWVCIKMKRNHILICLELAWMW